MCTMKLKILHYGNPLLRQKAARVETFGPEVKAFVKDLIETLHTEHTEGSISVGLAATQVGKLLQIFAISVPVQKPDGKWAASPPQVFINPKLSNPSKEVQAQDEGCLSLPKLYGEVVRPLEITVTYSDIDGKEFTETFSGYPARIIMHENDHLNGVLFIDRLSPQERKSIEPELKAIKKKYSS
jgi:peptide deformylase